MTRNQRLVLIASILGSFVAFLDMAVVNVALPAIRRRSGRRHLRAAVDRRRLPADAGLVDPGRWLAVRSVRPQARVRGRPDRLRGASVLCAAAPNVADLDRGARTAGRRRRAAGSQLAGAHHRQLRGAGPGQGDRHVDRLDRHRVHARPARRRRAGRRRILALGVCDQRPPGRGHPDGCSRACRPRRARRSAPPSISSGAGLCAVGLGGVIFALIEQPGRGWGAPAIYLPLAGGLIALVGFLLVRTGGRAPHAGSRPVPQSELRRRQPGNRRDLRGLDRVDVPAHGVLAAGRGLPGVRQWPGAVAGHGDHVRPLARVRPASGTSRPAALHDGWSDHRRVLASRS